VTRAPLPGLHEAVTAKKASHSREWKLLVAGCILSGLMVGFGGGPLTWTFAIGLLAGTAVVVVRADLLHPYTWYTPVFFLYSTSYPILVWLEIYREQGFLHQACLMQWAALVTFVVVIGPARRPVVPPLKLLRTLAEPSLPVFCITSVVAVIYFWYLHGSGFTSKYEILLSSSTLVRIGGPAFSVFTVAFAAILASGFASRRNPYTAIAVTLVLSLAGVLIAGERDMFLRVVVISVFLVHALYRRIKAWEFAFLFLLGVFLVAVSAEVRNVMIVDRPGAFQFSDPADRILGGEFISAGRNLEELIEEMEREDLFWGETFWWDIKRTFVPGFLGYSTITPGTWFNERRYPVLVALGGSHGFTIVGEGYMNFGLTGVVVWFILLSLMARYLYSLSGRSAFWFLAYVVSTTLFLYVIRQDFAHLFSQTLKHILFPLLVILAAERVTEKIKSLQAATRIRQLRPGGTRPTLP